MVTREAGPPAKSQWVRSISALTLLLLLASCKGKTTIREWLASKDALSYAQYTSLEQGTALEAIRTAFGPGEDPLLHEGVTRGLTYACEDSAGNVVPLKLAFDRAGHLEAWALGSEPAKSSYGAPDPGAPFPGPHPEPSQAAEAFFRPIGTPLAYTWVETLKIKEPTLVTAAQ